jgi:hypothetical protein
VVGGVDATTPTDAALITRRLTPPPAIAWVIAVVARADTGLGCPVGADRGDHCVDVAQRSCEHLPVRAGQV